LGAEPRKGRGGSAQATGLGIDVKERTKPHRGEVPVFDASGSIPNVSLIIFDLITRQQLPKLFLKRFPPMMFLLVGNVFQNVIKA